MFHRFTSRGRASILLTAAGIALLLAACAFGLRGGQPQESESLLQPPPASQEEPAAPKEDVVTFLLCGLDDSAGLTDVIMVVRFCISEKQIDVLQIPRDTYIGEDYRTGKINQVYYAHSGDPEPARGLAGLLEEQMALPVDYYGVITLKTFRELVDAIGGVTMDVPRTIDFLPGKVIEPGVQTLDGERAEWFVRYRAGYVQGDIGRINAQKLMIDGLVQAVHDRGRAQMLGLASQHYGSVETDLPLAKALSYANAAFFVERENIRIHTLEGTGVMHNGYAVYEADREALTELLNQYFRPENEPVEELAIARVPPQDFSQAPPPQTSRQSGEEPPPEAFPTD